MLDRSRNRSSENDEKTVVFKLQKGWPPCVDGIVERSCRFERWRRDTLRVPPLPLQLTRSHEQQSPPRPHDRGAAAPARSREERISISAALSPTEQPCEAWWMLDRSTHRTCESRMNRPHGMRLLIAAALMRGDPPSIACCSCVCSSRSAQDGYDRLV